MTTLDGIPAFVGTKEGPLTAGLIVRAGECDEQLAHHGISHLVEHLLLGNVGRHLTSWNGFVDLQTTNFVVHGSPDEVVEFFDSLCTTLLDPPYARIPTEAQVLRTEAASRGGRGILAAALRTRIGPRNYGLRDYREFCFDQPSPQLVHHWISSHYTTGNAAFWCTGPLPEGLHLRLPPGEASPIPPPTWIDEVYPGFVHERNDNIALTVIDTWSTELLVALAVAREHLFDLLRTTHGLSYDVSTATESLGCGRLLHAAVWADGLAENLTDVRDRMSAEMQRLCWDGPSPEVLERFRATMRRALADDDDSPVAAQARCHVFGTKFNDIGETLAVAEELDPTRVAATLATAMRSALWLVPGQVGWYDRRVTGTRPWSTSVVTGNTIPIAVPEDDTDRRRLVVGTDGLSMLHGNDSNPVTVRFDQVAALLAYPDGDRSVIGDDGFVVRIEASRWPDAGGLIRYVDSRVAASRIVYMPPQK